MPRRPDRKPVCRRAPARRRNPDEFAASRVYYHRLAEREFRVSEMELVAHERVAMAADELAKAIRAFDRAYPDGYLMTPEERAVLFGAMRVFQSIAIPSSSFTVVERRMPARYPGKR